MDKEIIPPGDSVALDISFATRLFNGPVTRQPKIITTDDTTYVEVIANVVADPDSTYPVVINPAILGFTLEGPDADSILFEINNLTDKGLILTIIDFPESLIDLTVPAVVKAGETIICRARLTSDGYRWPFEESITLELNDPDHSRFTIPIVRTASTSEKQVLSSENVPCSKT